MRNLVAEFTNLINDISATIPSLDYDHNIHTIISTVRDKDNIIYLSENGSQHHRIETE